MVHPQTVTPTPITTTTIKTMKMTENLELSTQPVRHAAKRTTPQGDVLLEPTQQKVRLSGIKDQ